MSPEKETGAISHAPIPKPGVQYAACVHSATVIERMPEGHTHHAREVCAVCGGFIRWLAKPETLVRQRLNVFRLAKLGMCSGLTEWESRFVADVSKRRKVSPRQQAIIDELCDKHLKGAAE
jgi:hypothetical protein